MHSWHIPESPGLPVIADEVVPLGEHPTALELLRTAEKLVGLVLEHPQ